MHAVADTIAKGSSQRAADFTVIVILPSLPFKPKTNREPRQAAPEGVPVRSGYSSGCRKG